MNSQFIDTLLARNFDLKSFIRGCDDSTISSIEAFYDLTLPSAYKDFLLSFGCSQGREPEGTISFMPGLMENTAYARELLGDSASPFCFPNNAFAFSIHQGYSFLFFYCDGNDNPAVYLYVEGEPDQEEVCPSLSQFFLECLRELLRPAWTIGGIE